MIRTLILCLALTGCAPQQTIWCRNLAPAQAIEWIRENGRGTAKVFMLANGTADTTHMQAKVLYRGEWRWIANHPTTEYLSEDPQWGCTPLYEVDVRAWNSMMMRIPKK